jgi:hypothetical protein
MADAQNVLRTSPARYEPSSESAQNGEDHGIFE